MKVLVLLWSYSLGNYSQSIGPKSSGLWREVLVSTNISNAGSNSAIWAGRVIGGLPALFLFVDAVAKLFKPAAVVEGTVRLGYQESVIIPLGIVLLICTILYAIRTCVLGAILVTGYLGGAVATHVRFGEGTFPSSSNCPGHTALGRALFARPEIARVNSTNLTSQFGEIDASHNSGKIYARSRDSQHASH